MKTKRLTYILFTMLALAGCVNLYAQKFTASTSKTTVGTGEQFQVTYAINANGSGFTAPSFAGFQLAGGPYESSSMQFINGNVSQSISYSYVLIPEKTGSFTIGPATIHSGGKTISSNSLTITVVKGNAPARQQSTAQSNPASTEGTVPSSEVKKRLFIRIIPGKTKAYQGEAIPITIKIYARIGLQGFQDINYPDYNGFYNEDVPQKGQVALTQENVDGVPFEVAILKQSVIFPQHTGKLKIDPVTASCVVQERVRSNDPNDLIGQFFGTYRKSVYNIKSDPITIDVLPLPHTDKSFSGAVGQYTLKGSLDKSSVKANDAVNLNVTISGQGELKLIDSIPLQFPPDFDHYDPKITDHINVTPTGISGTRSFNYVLIPRHEGNYKIPPVNFTYFDPAKKSYETLTIPEMDLAVAKGNNNAAVMEGNNVVNKEDIKLLGSDIRYIHTGHQPAYYSNDYFLYSWQFYTGLCVPLLAFLGLLFVRRRYIEMNKDIVSVKQRGATRMAKKRLKVANSFIASGNKESFYEELHKAINGYLGDKFTIPVADLSRETISQKLAGKKVSEETLQKLSAVLDDCEYARYAPASVTGNLQGVYDNAVKLITQLEDEIVH